jgi:hypothetical protein
MEVFTELFGSLLVFVYHGFDRIVIHGYLSALSRPEQAAQPELGGHPRECFANRVWDSIANLVYGPAETLTELSAVQNLYVGDLISTGAPAGCALSVPSPARQRIAALPPERLKWKMFMNVRARRNQYLKPGDIVEARIATSDGAIDLGAQRNRIVSEAA